MRASRHLFLASMALCMTVYAGMLLVSVHVLESGAPDDPLRPLIALSPILPAIGICWGVFRKIQRMDEMQRKIQLEALSVAFSATALISLSYGFLEGVGFPRLSMFWIWFVMAGLWAIGVIVNQLRYR